MAEGTPVRHPVLRYIGRRLVLGAAMLAIVSVAVFFFTQALPGDVARQVLGQTATEAQVAQMRERLGLDQPVTTQYGRWVAGLVSFDMGTSLTSRTSVAELVAQRVANSAALVAATAAILLPLALALGIAAARRPGGLVDSIVSGTVLFMLALPEFIIAVLVVVLLATNVLHLFPPTSILNAREPLWAQARLFALPVLALVVGSLPYSAESIKTAVREELASEHVLWARLSGIREARILWRHALPNALAPSLQVAGTTLIYLTGGIVAVENVFAFPGVGAALTAAVANRDIPVVQALAMLLAVTALVIYLAADILGLLLTPRLRTALGR
jgi:peptide/nickel transport system permease protein